MTFNFSVQKINIFGSYGEFSVGTEASQIRAQYLLTKIKPGQQGSWENQLASQMAPWREIFNTEELSFDELIQRDLDDSRVAHDMIPYLLGETGHHARFFPPILAVLVPKREGKTGIAPLYPEPKQDGELITFGDLFDFEKAVIGGNVSPLGVIRYNPQRTAMVIVDGQHRAMAVLALHRQLNKIWGSDPFAPYYSHIQVTPESVGHIELPVCIMYFPDLHEGNDTFCNTGVDLTTVCREIFTVVNKQAKEVSKSRELLLDDEDFAAFMMRRTLSSLKDRNAENADAARIYSFAFGDSEGDSGSQVMAGQLEYCSAVAIHKMHAATGFGLPAVFNITKSADVTDGRYVRNPTRPVELLTGTDGAQWIALGRRSAKSRTPGDVKLAVELIGDITDAVMLPLFDQLRPFAAHNLAMRNLLEALNDPSAKADPVQSKCRTLLFDGTGTRHVFEEHVSRLKEREKEIQDQGKQVPAHLAQQIAYCDAVSRALQTHEENIRLQRAFVLFGIDAAAFGARDKTTVETETRSVKSRGKPIFDAVSTQAFQIGYLMAVLTTVERMLPSSASYADRLSTTKFVSKLYLSAVNTFFAVTATKHKSLNGYIAESRARAFEASSEGFRGLLAAANVRELNEKQWEFFRYMVLEVVHSKMASSIFNAVLEDTTWEEQAKTYRAILPSLITDTHELRNRYFEAAVRTAMNSPEFKRDVALKEAQAKAESKTEAEVQLVIDSVVAERRTAVLEVCKGHIKASLGHFENVSGALKRLVSLPSQNQASLDARSDSADGSVILVDSEFDVALATDTVLHQSVSNETDR